jgi:hypothetical protein
MRRLLPLLVLCCLLLPQAAKARAAETTIIGLFTGCRLDRGLNTCRIVATTGRHYVVSTNAGCGAFSGNTEETVFDAIDSKAWLGKMVAVKARLAPDGTLARVASIALTGRPQPATWPHLDADASRTGVVGRTEDGYVFTSGKTRSVLVPGDGLDYVALDSLERTAAGRPVTLRGNILREKTQSTFEVTTLPR